ncbi:MAG TPA: STAS domain-containing protein [Nevskiaceae bacterium]|nr:STAS domain-containing protein [Nevskiaceae bacterium]
MHTQTSTPDAAVIRLPAELAIEDAAALREQLLTHVDDETPVTLEAADITRIHTAALQQLYLFCRDRRAAGRSVHWSRVSPALKSAADLAGVTRMLAPGQE